MRIQLTSVIVEDQAKGLDVYTRLLGFVKRKDIDLGGARWLTVISPEGHADVELVLEPAGIPAAQAYQRALYAEGIPLTAFASRDVAAEYERLRERGVEFKTPPTPAGPTVLAVFDDRCGNWIQIFQDPAM